MIHGAARPQPARAKSGKTGDCMAAPSGRDERMNPQKGICAPARAAPTRVSGAQSGSRGDAKGGHEFARRDLLAVPVLRFEHLDPATLRGDEKAVGADLGYFADLAFDVTERAEQVLAAIENLQF